MRPRPRTKMLSCTKCKQSKPLSDFSPAKRKLNGLSSLCRSCHQAATVAWQQANKERVKANRRRRYAERKAAGTLLPRKYDAARTLEQNRFLRYRVTPEWYADQLARQGNACAICRRPDSSFKRPLAVDHDHACCRTPPTCGECNRGLLCHSCNTALHNIERDAAWLPNALSYLG